MKFVKKKINLRTKNKICSLYKKRVTIEKICTQHKISATTVYEILRENKIPLRGNKLDLNLERKICKLYLAGWTISKISDKLNVGKSSIQKYLKKNKIQTRIKAGGFERKYKLNESVFETIDSFEKAQFLGLIYSDGTISTKNKLVSIRLREDDSDYLDCWRRGVLKTNKPLYKVEKRKTMVSPMNGKTYSVSYGACSLDITSKKIYEDVTRIGLCPNKTKANLHMPKILNRYKPGFILGLFEGDGSITSNKKAHTYSFTMACQSNMAKNIYDYLHGVGIKCHHYTRKHINIIQISSIENIIKIYDLLYFTHKSKFIMRRKYDKFTKMVNELKKKAK